MGRDKVDQMIKIGDYLGMPPNHMLVGSKVSEYFDRLPVENTGRMRWFWKADLQQRLQPRSLTTLLQRSNDADFVDLITRLLKYDPVDRLSAQECLKHPFFAGVSSQVIVGETNHEIASILAKHVKPHTAASSASSSSSSSSSSSMPSSSHVEQAS
jgi:serine/threonine protein kinase